MSRRKRRMTTLKRVRPEVKRIRNHTRDRTGGPDASGIRATRY
ncbi:hypothetical protein B7R56_11595 [Pseudomonas savastanoi pv. retacarpa]|uniref:Uncharacterized protein n=1 Tax=Pseudomonas savastanoi pv. nerii TaxID=360921 RepID=A0AB73QAY6_PSESS|nr:hypothetical protein BKM19_024340 [Pseudomonas amygdali pv. morsprunorum]KAA3546034.1 hypothetical protein DXU85_09535 [Pseudomonas savastanoi]KPB13801.1 Uncharacterized protein AC516_1477 [Pseudomonas amygdali pv. sesami]KPB59555.1 Uncharacterized protein AC510_0312 [Pseudomonas amygdali pv. myricae]OSR28247.1 hypothetical protein B7R56_11595 [Pseudomonas savastanoi pv. retacarpa]PAB30033.1 hypothetical protein CCZ00_17620 [Pseudomonas savastanoi pv. fraxini]PAB34488.1 hypothetical protei